MREAGLHTLEVVDPDRWATRAADVFAAAITAAVELRGVCVLALSGGNTPAPVFEQLAKRDLPWSDVVVTQVDERVAPDGSATRNLVGQKEAFGDLPVRWLPLPVGGAFKHEVEDLLADLADVAGEPPILDLVHLGLGADGHTASLVPDDPVLSETERTIMLTDFYRGTRRLTFTRPILDRARLLVWLVEGADKADALKQLIDADPGIPAALLRPQASVIIADPEAASRL